MENFCFFPERDKNCFLLNRGNEKGNQEQQQNRIRTITGCEKTSVNHISGNGLCVDGLSQFSSKQKPNRSIKYGQTVFTDVLSKKPCRR